RERERSLLGQSHRLVGGTQGFSQPGLFAMHVLQPPHRLVEIVGVWFAVQAFEEAYRIGRSPHLGRQRMTSPRREDRSAVSVKEFRETCRAKNSSSTEPSKNALLPSNASSSTSS